MLVLLALLIAGFSPCVRVVLAAYSTRLLNGFCLRSETPLREDKQCTSAVKVSHYLNPVHSGSQPSYGMEF